MLLDLSQENIWLDKGGIFWGVYSYKRVRPWCLEIKGVLLRPPALRLGLPAGDMLGFNLFSE